ncbi:hypothetical protein SDC9_164639 [bioreactor metagenome]|uniref:Uncharacterized protein n=1 Tax=bioreactor metagenome TaxID=1076179 RepID=A0A645FU49_9ZZZZ
MRKARFRSLRETERSMSNVASSSDNASSYSFFTYLPANSLYKSTFTLFFTKSTSISSMRKNFPVKSTIGRVFPSLSTSVSPGTSFSLPILASSAPKVGAICTIPVPSSVVTKSPQTTLKAFSVTFIHGKSCSYPIPASSEPFHVFSNTRKGIFLSPSL